MAAAEAIEKVFGADTRIKWVNDIFIENRKVAGILAKGTYLPEHGHCVILGIGANVYPPKEGFPADIMNTAGYITDKRKDGGLEELAAELISAFANAYRDLSCPQYVEKYRRRCLTIGRNVTVHPIGKDETKEAFALDIDSNFHLKVQYPDKTEELLSSGEVSVKI